MGYCTSLNDLRDQTNKLREQKGWVTSKENMLSKLMLVVTEVAEAAEEVRKGEWGEPFQKELADIIIRTLDIAGALNINIEQVVYNKLHEVSLRLYIDGKRDGTRL